MQRTVARFLDAVRQTLAHHDMLAPGAHVLVALSGGVDSTAALASLAALAPRLKITVSAAHINHGLRGAESDADAATAQLLAARLAVPLHVRRLSGALRHGGNTEERAREARYAALAAVARRCRATHVATGHTRDDQAETVLLRLIRGCGPSGLVAILPVTRVEGIPVVRPLLNCRRAEAEQFVAALELSCCADSSNRDRRFLRNRIRLDVLPQLRTLNPQIDRALADLAALSREREALVVDAVQAIPQTLTVSGLRTLPPSRRAETVRRWLTGVRGDTRGLSKRHIESVLGLVGEGRPNRRVDLPGGMVLQEYDRLRFVRRMGPQPEPGSPQAIKPGQRLVLNEWRIEAGRIQPRDGDPRLPGDLWSAVVDAEVAAAGLWVRTPARGDRVQPCGMVGRRKLSDIFVDNKVPRALRDGRPIVQAGADILWVPGLVRGRLGLVGPRTRRVFWLRAKTAAPPLLG